MTDSNIITIAKKEFKDHVRSSKFLIIMGIFLIGAIVGAINGMDQYNNALASYNEEQNVVSSSDLSLGIEKFLNDKPSMLQVFYNISHSMLKIGSILGIAMAFDLLSKEKESKSLKILLAHPVYRDEVINGKALGGIAALGLALSIVLAISLATLTIIGIIPNGSEIILIGIFAIVSFVFIFTYYAIALFISAISNDSGKALVYTMIIYILITILIPTLMSTPILNSVTGPPPEMPQVLIDRMTSPSSNSNDEVSFPGGSPLSMPSPELLEFQKKIDDYTNKQMAILNVIYLVTPDKNYEKITMAITKPQVAELIFGSHSGSTAADQTGSGFASTATGETVISIPDLLDMVGNNLIALFIFPAVFFGLAYVIFMRLDIR